MTRALGLGFAFMALLGVLPLLPASAAETRLAGFLLDRSCADNLKAGGYSTDSFREHKKECALNENCSKDGYAVFSKGQWYLLDAKGNELSRKLLKSTSTSEGHFVLVTGAVEKNGEIKVSSVKELAAGN